MTEGLEWRAADGTRIWVRRWKPATKPKAAILLIHGLGEHAGRYEHVAEFFTQSGYAVDAFDLRGHGRSQGRRGHIRSYDTALDDIQAMLEAIQLAHPGLPVFLYGHSLGANMAMTFVLARNPALAGVIATAALLAPATKVSPAKLAFAKLLYRLVPAFTLSNGLPSGALSRDPRVQVRVDADPLYHHRVSARLGLDFLEAGLRIQRVSGVFPLPLLLMQGSADRIVDPGPPARLAAGLTGDVTFRTWEGFYHELHNEPEWPKVLAVVMTWIEKHSGSTRRPSGRRTRKAAAAKPRRGR